MTAKEWGKEIEMGKKYTPGPWSVGSGSAFQASIYAGRLNIGFACEEYGRIDSSTAAANARLIAAAPELLEALEAMLDEDDGGMAANKARTAIAKARGEVSA